jgi:capsule polysaccharide export protein KpsE/RkpR
MIMKGLSLRSFAFLRRRDVLLRVVAITFAGAVIGLVYAKWITPQWFQSVLTVVPVKAQRSGFSGLLGSELSGLAAGIDSGASADGARIAFVLQSGAVSDAVIQKFGLQARYKQKYLETTRSALWRHCNVKTLPRPNVVQLTCEDRDPRFVQEMLTFFAEHGNLVFRRVNVSSASEEVRFLEKRVAELRQQAESASGRMREFQEKHQIVDLDTQARAVVTAMATLNSQRVEKELEADFARKYSSSDESSMRQLESQISVVQDKLRDLEDPGEIPAVGRRGGKGAQGGLFPAALAVPKLRAEYEALLRERKVAEATLMFALDRLEGAKASEARDVSTFQVLDPPVVPTYKSRPKTEDGILFGAALGLILSVAFEGWKARRATSPQVAGEGRRSA